MCPYRSCTPALKCVTGCFASVLSAWVWHFEQSWDMRRRPTAHEFHVQLTEDGQCDLSAHMQARTNESAIHEVLRISRVFLPQTHVGPWPHMEETPPPMWVPPGAACLPQTVFRAMCAVGRSHVVPVTVWTDWELKWHSHAKKIIAALYREAETLINKLLLIDRY